jgi:hypothetical protein
MMHSNAINKKRAMPCRNLIGAVLFAALSLPTGDARAWDDAKYPNWKGQWLAINPPLGGQTPVKFDPTKAAGWPTKLKEDSAITRPLSVT